MRPIGRIILFGAIAVLVFDGIASYISLRQGYPYTDFTPGSFIIYAIAGFVAAKAAGWKGAAITGIALGLIDASLGCRWEGEPDGDVRVGQGTRPG